MTVGIYALYWKEQDLIYIGLSQSIELRYSEHLRTLKYGVHSNYKVQNAYNNYGIPDLYIVEICEISELNEKEIFWTKEFDSIDSGLNIVEAGNVGFGTNSSASKYSKFTILRVFSYLYRTTNTHKIIAKKSNVPVAVVQDISRGRTHLWLKDRYPNQYSTMKTLNVERKILNNRSGPINDIQWNILEDPNGCIYHITNALKFCKEHPLLSSNLENSRKNIGRLLIGSRKSWRGWKIVNTT